MLLHAGAGSLFAPQWSQFRLPKPWTGEPVPDAAVAAPELRISSQTPQIDYPDGHHIIATGLKGEIIVRDRETGEVRHTITCHSGIDLGKGDWTQRTPDMVAQEPSHLAPEQHGLWRVRQANAERFSLLLFSPDQSWFATGSSWGMRVWRTADLLAGGPPRFSCEGRLGGATSGSGSTYCYAIAFDESRSLVLFAGMEGIVDALDLQSGRVVTLLDPPERLTVLRLGISPDGVALALEAMEVKRNSERLPELRLWSYPALCEAAGLPPPA
jgi:WD40 repeat protein